MIFNRAIIIIYLLMFACTINTNELPNSYSEEVLIVYDWIKMMQQDNGLVLTYEFNNFSSIETGYEVSLYDNALAVILFSVMGDFERAEKVLDFYNARLDSEFIENNYGFAQFRYPSTGEPKSLDRWMGDNAWLLIAINNYHYLADNENYSIMAAQLTSMLIELQNSEGYIRSGYSSDKSTIEYFVMEGNLDAYNAVEGYSDYHQKILNYIITNRWNNEDRLLLADTRTDDESIYYRYAMDCSPWGYSVLPYMTTDILSQADIFLTKKATTYSSVIIEGYSFDIDKSEVWFEGTAQMAVAFYSAGMYTEYNQLINEIENGFITSTNHPTLYGLPYVTNDSGTYYRKNNLYDQTDDSPHISSSVWYLFAKLRFNPFAIGDKAKFVDEISW